MTPPHRGSRAPRRLVTVLALVGFAATGPAGAGHELPFYPGYYPQEIKIETVAPEKAAPRLRAATLHAYVGADPFAGARLPADVAMVESLGSYLVLSFNPASPAATSREGRCEAARRIVRTLAPGGWTRHPSPLTPYHADYLQHFDLIQSARKAAEGSGPGATLRVRARGPLAERIARPAPRGDGKDWDATLEEAEVAELAAAAGTSFGGGLGPPWLKEGWFHAYLLQARALADADARQQADSLYRRLTTGGYGGLAERMDLERGLVRALGAGCERVVVGYTVRREPYSSEFSQGVENVAWDSQAGMDSAIFIRTAKLKDFPWNGWLHVAVPARPAAAWNPVAGFGDPVGRLIWSAVGDPAMLPAPYGASWIANRVAASAVVTGGVEIPDDALVPDAATGLVREVGRGKTARARVVYRVVASAFHDNTRMTAADAVYPYLFAARWGGKRAGGTEHDPAVDAATAVARDWLAGFRILRVDSEVKKYSDITFTYVVPVIEVYLNREAADPREIAAAAPPWSPVPWHVMALMEEAVKRGGFAFSAGEASRRGARWLDLARDPRARETLSALLAGFAAQAWVPPGLKRFVDADEAQNRWNALRQFVQRRGHFLVTSGPYQLDRWSDTTVTLAVFRDFTSPMGVGTFDRFAVPRRAFVSHVASQGGRLEVHAEVERVERFMREHRIVREAFAAPAGKAERADVPVCRYVILDAAGAVAAAGATQETAGAALVVDLRGKLRPGAHTALVTLSLGEGHPVSEVTAAEFRVEAAP